MDVPATKADGTKRRILANDWTYEFSWKYDRYRITVPEGERVLPTIPAIFTPIVPMRVVEPAAVPHDALYNRVDPDIGLAKSSDILEVKKGGEWVPVATVRQQIANDLFYHILRETGVETWRRWLVWIAVEIAGPFAWHFEN